MNEHNSERAQKTGDTTPIHKPVKGIQRAAVNSTPTDAVSPVVQDTLKSPGQSLDAGTRAFMEPRFGHDFSNVRVHTDSQAAESARSVDALAYTVGQDVVFGAGQYAPETGEGKQLLAHELTHTLQQPQGQALMAAPLQVNDPRDAYEQEADHVAQTVLSHPAEAGIAHEAAPATQLPVGNAGTAMVQRATPWTFSPTKPRPINLLDPATTEAAASKVIADEQAPVRQWLDAHTMTLRNMSMEQLVIEVKHNVPLAVKLADAEIQNLIQQWAITNHIGIKQPEQPTTYDKIADAAIGAISLASEGVKVTPSPLETKVSITGATATLKVGNVDIEGTLGISRKVEISVAYGKYKFAAEVAGKEWKLTLSFGADEIPDLGSVAKTFKEGEKSIRAIARDTASLSDPEHAKNAQEALEGLSKIVQAVGKRFEISVGSAESDDSPGGGKKGGVQVMGQVTLIKF